MNKTLWDLDVPIPSVRFPRNPCVVALRDMPAEASMFFAISHGEASSYIKRARGSSSRRYTQRKQTENGAHGIRIWKTAE